MQNSSATVFVLCAIVAAACGSDPRPTASVPTPASTSAQTSAPSASGAPVLPSSADLDAGPATAPTGDAAPDADAGSPVPRIGSTSHYSWIYGDPSRRRQPIGYVRPGTAVALADDKPASGTGCSTNKWMRVEPKGFVCNDNTTTLDLESELYKALVEVVAPRTGALPYRYAYSTGAPMYGRVPTADEQRRAERGFAPVAELPTSGKPRSGYEELARYEVLRGTDPVPALVAGGRELPRMRGYAPGLVRKTIPFASLLSFSRAFEEGGRTYLLSTDLTLVPADRVRPFSESAFHGVALDASSALPIGWTRRAPRDKYRRRDDGTFEKTGDVWPPRSLLQLTGAQQQDKHVAYLETRDAGLFVRANDVSVVDVKEQLPSSVTSDQKWIEFSASKGTFTLYVGKRPVYTTLASPGAGGGAPSSKLSVEELVQGSFTPLGIYRVTFKTRATTMTPEGTPNPKDHWIQDVPYTQYFWRPFAIHTAYWHEDFGMPKSGGCVNLSPIDARYVFDWTDPAVPHDWSGASSSNEMGLGTAVVLRR